MLLKIRKLEIGTILSGGRAGVESSGDVPPIYGEGIEERRMPWADLAWRGSTRDS